MVKMENNITPEEDKRYYELTKKVIESPSMTEDFLRLRRECTLCTLDNFGFHTSNCPCADATETLTMSKEYRDSLVDYEQYKKDRLDRELRIGDAPILEAREEAMKYIGEW